MTSGLSVNPTVDQLLAAPPASKSSLIATFCGSDRTSFPPPHHAALYRTLAETSADAPVPRDWPNPRRGIFLRYFEPDSPDVEDTAAVQLIMNASGPVTHAWSRLLEVVMGCLDGGMVDANWGYTLIFQAVTPPDVDLTTALRAWSAAVRSLTGRAFQVPLADSWIPGGWIWLMAVPMFGDGLEAATIYVALGPSSTEDVLLSWLGGASAPLLIPDLIAHKAYYELRGFRSGLRPTLHERQLALQTSTRQLVTAGSRMQPEISLLASLARSYDELAIVVPSMTDARVALLKKLQNLEYRQEQIGDNRVLAFHHRHLATGARELELTTESLQVTLQTARNAVSVAQVVVDRARAAEQTSQLDQQREVERAAERRQRQIETLLASSALALAVTQLIDASVAAELLTGLRSIRGFSWLPAPGASASLDTAYGAWYLLTGRLAITGLVMVICWPLLGRLVGWLAYRSSRPEDEAD